MDKQDVFLYGGARALTQLHDHHLRLFLKTWQAAKADNISLPETTDTDYQSLNHLLYHALSAARGYMVWICKCLDLDDPEIKEVPRLETIENEANVYLEHILERWQSPLKDVEAEKFYRPSYTSNWGADYCIDAMLEHAVMHPLRHTFQLKQLMVEQKA